MAYQHTTDFPVPTTHQVVGTRVAPAIPGFDAHAAMKGVPDTHSKGMGDGIVGAVHALKEKIPGTAEHKVNHPLGATGGVGVNGAEAKAHLPGTTECYVSHSTIRNDLTNTEESLRARAHATNGAGNTHTSHTGTTQNQVPHSTIRNELLHPGEIGAHAHATNGAGVSHNSHTGESVAHKIMKHVPGTQAHAEKKISDRATSQF